MVTFDMILFSFFLSQIPLTRINQLESAIAKSSHGVLKVQVLRPAYG
jgi:hypothetical protein